jgi:hypothetical protein
MEGVDHGVEACLGPVVELSHIPVFLGFGKMGVKKHG